MKKLQETFASINDKLNSLQKTKGCCELAETTEKNCCYDSVVSDLRWQFDYLQRQISDVWNLYYGHLNGHIPEIQGAGAMNKALKALGIDGDYKVEPKVIYASTGEPKSIVVNITKAELKA